METIEDYQLASRALEYLRSLDYDVTGPLIEEPRYRLTLWSDYHQAPVLVPFSTSSLVQWARLLEGSGRLGAQA